MELTLRQMLRASYVHRWHIINVVKPQSVAEHTFNVCLIAEFISKLLGQENEIPNLYRYALHHDIPEVVIGDIPTPAKSLLGLDKSSKMDDLCIELDWWSICSDDKVKRIIKLADYVDAISYLALNGVGKQAADVRTGIIKLAHNHLLESGFAASEQQMLRKWLDHVVTWDTQEVGEQGAIWYR